VALKALAAVYSGRQTASIIQFSSSSSRNLPDLIIRFDDSTCKKMGYQLFNMNTIIYFFNEILRKSVR